MLLTLSPFVFYVALHLFVTTGNGKHSVFDGFLFAREYGQLSPTIRMYITRNDGPMHLPRESENGIRIRKELTQRVRYTFFIIFGPCGGDSGVGPERGGFAPGATLYSLPAVIYVLFLGIHGKRRANTESVRVRWFRVHCVSQSRRIPFAMLATLSGHP